MGTEITDRQRKTITLLTEHVKIIKGMISTLEKLAEEAERMRVNLNRTRGVSIGLGVASAATTASIIFFPAAAGFLSPTSVGLSVASIGTKVGADIVDDLTGNRYLRRLSDLQKRYVESAADIEASITHDRVQSDFQRLEEPKKKMMQRAFEQVALRTSAHQLCLNAAVKCEIVGITKIVETCTTGFDVFTKISPYVTVGLLVSDIDNLWDKWDEPHIIAKYIEEFLKKLRGNLRIVNEAINKLE